jgi:sugar phosphate isomerase/epimerase
MGAGLWLSAEAVAKLGVDPGPLIDALDASGCSLFTLNGFPYGDFHEARVKERVYSPAWDREERLDYTLALARTLGACLPTHCAEGTISTLPLGFGPAWDPERHARSLQNLCRLAEALARLADHSGRPVRVCLEPEPGCVLESRADVLRLFDLDLPAAARRHGVSRGAIETHLGICLDLCHSAVCFEDPVESIDRLSDHGVPIGKIQISSAIQIDDLEPAVLARVAADFAEPRYLHQVRVRTNDSGVIGRMDLEQALEDPDLPRTGPWRVHFHVPIHETALAQPGVSTTQGVILEVLRRLTKPLPLQPHLEVETYTWEVLPAGLRPHGPDGLAASLTAELAWLETRMTGLGLIEGARDAT